MIDARCVTTATQLTDANLHTCGILKHCHIRRQAVGSRQRRMATGRPCAAKRKSNALQPNHWPYPDDNTGKHHVLVQFFTDLARL